MVKKSAIFFWHPGPYTHFNKTPALSKAKRQSPLHDFRLQDYELARTKKDYVTTYYTLLAWIH